MLYIYIYIYIYDVCLKFKFPFVKMGLYSMLRASSNLYLTPFLTQGMASEG